MSIEISEFYQEFQQDVCAHADVCGRYVEDAFFDVFCNHLLELGEIDSADRSYYQVRGMRVDGYELNLTSNVFSLIVSDYTNSSELIILTSSEMDSIFKRVVSFIKKSFEPSFRYSLEEVNPAFGLADLIANRWNSFLKVRLLLISNRIVSSRIDGKEAVEINGIPVTYSVWDMERLYKIISSGHGREDIIIDLAGINKPLLALPAYLNDVDYEAYLVVVPGSLLADIYDKWGARLLEQNVRVFLQARGNINKGIKNTIENNPEMFFAYNNGITATAESVDTCVSDNGLLITGLKNFQIVNGGQTTASIHSAGKSKDKKIDLSKVFVQMKLSIITPDRVETVVPKISEYANSQNRVNAADFFSNHPYHMRMAEFSRRIFAPSPDGTFRQTKWFYERSRGQYQDAKANLSLSEKKKFELEYPKNQVFTKTDLAKYINSWEGFPHIVSKGAQKNFAYFAGKVGADWGKQQDFVNEVYFKQSVAKAIIFRETEKLVTEQKWYQGGYRANIVTYTIAKLARDLECSGGICDFENIWRKQGISIEFKRALTMVATEVHDMLVNTPNTISNVTEWAKLEACWSRILALKIQWPEGLLEGLLAVETKHEILKNALKEQKLLNGIEAQSVVVKAGSTLWNSLYDWCEDKNILTPDEVDSLLVATKIPSKIPNARQSKTILSALKRLHIEGCQIGLDIFN